MLQTQHAVKVFPALFWEIRTRILQGSFFPPSSTNKLLLYQVKGKAGKITRFSTTLINEKVRNLRKMGSGCVLRGRGEAILGK